VPFPTIDPFLLVIIIFFGLLVAMMVGQQLVSARSPHVMYRPEQLTTTLDDVVGIDTVKEDVVRSLNLFLAHKTFRDEMGGSPRRGLLFEGAPGTGKTHLARAMAREAGVPFLFVSATSFQSMWYGATAKRIRSYFKALRKAARKEGGAIGFIEEIDAIAMARGGVANGMTGAQRQHDAVRLPRDACLPSSYAAVASGATVQSAFTSEGTGGVVNELLVQMQSFDDPTGGQRLRGWFVDRLNLLLPPERQLKRPVVVPSNILLIAATNRADGLDPALLRPGRFDRRVTFEVPVKAGRRTLLDHFLAKKAHAPELDDPQLRDALAAVTQGYSPVMIEHLLDEALVNAVRRGDTRSRTPTSRGPARRGGRDGPAGGLHRPRAPADRHARGRPRDDGLADRPGAPARGAHHRQAAQRAGAARARRPRGRLHPLPHEMQALIQIAMGGQCAEELFFGDVSTGPGGDLLYATNAAAEMVGAHGMDDSLVSYAAVQSSFGGTNLVGRVLADDRGRDAVERLLQDQKAVARQLLSENRHLVEALRDALLEREELVGHEITDVLEAAAAAPRVVDLTLHATEAPAPPLR
jgi:ATP-dependent Zn protease